jgi:hypothetical protein
MLKAKRGRGAHEDDEVHGLKGKSKSSYTIVTKYTKREQTHAMIALITFETLEEIKDTIITRVIV